MRLWGDNGLWETLSGCWCIKCVRKEKGVDGLGIVEGRVLYKWEEVHKEKCWDQIWLKNFAKIRGRRERD